MNNKNNATSENTNDIKQKYLSLLNQPNTLTSEQLDCLRDLRQAFNNILVQSSNNATTSKQAAHVTLHPSYSPELKNVAMRYEVSTKLLGEAFLNGVQYPANSWSASLARQNDALSKNRLLDRAVSGDEMAANYLVVGNKFKQDCTTRQNNRL
ncbi:hypothetical protein [Furfurilactobacillus milii]|uniref:Uncharacterized protein n=1 Tax=Furfurilactobacillus milii TaxID=2888272 RepID=A0A6N9I3K6_9LACO|nr:hypothetical protein [Furfurilactobacillus milii]MYV17561.1 hypothetical protein [Furfurilactobacillus milii]